MPDDPTPTRRLALPITHPGTGEVLELDEAGLAGLRDELGELKRRTDSALADVDVALSARLDLDNVRSARFGPWHVETEAPLETVWDKGRLGVTLEALVRAGRISRAAAAAALEAQPVQFKARARELDKLLGSADPEIVAVIDACRHAEPRPRRRVTVRRAESPQALEGGARKAIHD